MSEDADDRELFERHPDIRNLRGVEGPHVSRLHSSVQAKLDLFAHARVLARLSQVPAGGLLRINWLTGDGQEQVTTFRRPETTDTVGHIGEGWMLLRQDGESAIEEPANLFGSCASPSGALLEAVDDPNVRQHAYFAYAVVYPVVFRHGSEVPGTPYESYDVPEKKLSPSILAQHLVTRYIRPADNGELYWHEIDQDKSREWLTGSITSVEVTAPTS